jgi:hypothetical protein
LSVKAFLSLLFQEILESGPCGMYAAMAFRVTDRFKLEADGTGTVMLEARSRDGKYDGEGIA